MKTSLSSTAKAIKRITLDDIYTAIDDIKNRQERDYYSLNDKLDTISTQLNQKIDTQIGQVRQEIGSVRQEIGQVNQRLDTIMQMLVEVLKKD
jgi:septal ring factor EnvC (AmiA/AmiB activator)